MQFQQVLSLLAAILVTTGCGGGGGCDYNKVAFGLIAPQNCEAEAPTPLIGKFLDTAGIDYETPTQKGKTNTFGEFIYLPGETVTFKLYGTTIGSVAGTSVVTLGTSGATNGSAQTYVMYAWAEIRGFSKFGVYTGNGDASGSYINCGFKPKFLMIKRSDNVGDWYIMDSVRNPNNPVTLKLMADLNVIENGNGESTSTNIVDFLSNGFKIRNTNTATNTSGGTFIYMAFADTPFKNAIAR
jgi:hypothetical protein